MHQQPCGNQGLVSVPDPKPTPARIAFLHVILEAIYALDEVWGKTNQGLTDDNFSPYSSEQDGTLHVEVCILDSAEQLWGSVVCRALQKFLQFFSSLQETLRVGRLVLSPLHDGIQVATSQFGVVVLLLEIWNVQKLQSCYPAIK